MVVVGATAEVMQRYRGGRAISEYNLGGVSVLESGCVFARVIVTGEGRYKI